MIKYTLEGFKKDSSNLKDKAAIRFINLLDKLRGDYPYGKEEGQEKTEQAK